MQIYQKIAVHPVPDAQAPRPRFVMLLLLALYLSQGLPLGFVTQALPVVLREQQASLVVIGYVSALLLPWAFKPLWAPLQDRYYWRRLGLGRSWIIPTQLLTLCVTAALAWQEPQLLRNWSTAWPFVALLLLLALAGAVQDVSTDGLAVRLLGAGERSLGNAIQVAGNRLGLILGGGGILLLLDIVHWRWVMLALFALFVLTFIPVLLLREPHWPHLQQRQSAQTSGRASGHAAQPGFLRAAWQRSARFLREEFAHFLSTRELRAWLGVLIAFKLCDGLSSTMVKPMLVDYGYSKTEMGWAITILGSAASALGAMAGYALMKTLRHSTALIGFNALQALTTGLYTLIVWGFARYGRSPLFDSAVYAMNALEHFVAAMALVALLTTAMDYCRAHKGSSDFTLQVGIGAAASGTAHALSGHMAKQLGFGLHYLACMALGLLFLLPLIYWRHQQQPRANP